MSRPDPDSRPTSAELPAGDPGHIAYLDRALWQRFTRASSAPEFASAWLALQTSMFTGVTHGAVVLGADESGPYTPVAIWPEGNSVPPGLSRVAETAMAERRGTVHHHKDQGNPAHHLCHLAYPLQIDDQLFGVVALEINNASDEQLKLYMRHLQWGSGWLLSFINRNSRTTSSVDQQSLLIELIASALEHRRFQAASMAVVTELATRLKCDRVSLGFRKGKHMKIYALSHSAQFGEQTNLVRAISNAMDEAIDQWQTIIFPSPEDQKCITRAHDDLARTGGSSHICTVIMNDGDELFGSLCFERQAEKPFKDETKAFLENVAALIGPLLDIKQRDDRFILRKMLDSFNALIMKIIGPRHYGFKLITLILTALLVSLYFIEGNYRITGDAVLEGAVQRATVAPIDGYINQALARAGDVVEEGDLLFTIDDRDLRLEFVKWSSQKEQVQRKYRDALAERDRSEVNILKAQLDQAEAQLDLLQEQINRTRVTAPFNGVIVSGDLSQRLGSPVTRGDVLLEIAPLDEYRIAIQVDERDIADVRTGQRGQLVLTALPKNEYPFVIEKITPVSEAKDGRNRFRVEARLDADDDLLRPGMEGSGKINIDKRKLLWVWTHEFVDWLRLIFWYWRP